MGVDTSKLSAEDFKTYFSILCETQNWDFDLLWNAVAGYGDKRAEETVEEARKIAEKSEEEREEIAEAAVREYKAYLEYCRACVSHSVYEVYRDLAKSGSISEDERIKHFRMTDRILEVLRVSDLLDSWFDLPVHVFADQYGAGPETTAIFKASQKIAQRENYGPEEFEWICFKTKNTDRFHAKVDYKDERVRKIKEDAVPWYSRYYVMREMFEKSAEKYGSTKSLAARSVNAIARYAERDRWPKATASELLDLQYFGKECLELTKHVQRDFKNGEFDYLNE